ncbi:hypothetical protein B7494_g1711 [Chlorociboria aeruginascens]|nr:hypothetical protein B7494_g1711 [Chlorociboria aeruginascens]
MTRLDILSVSTTSTSLLLRQSVPSSTSKFRIACLLPSATQQQTRTFRWSVSLYPVRQKEIYHQTRDLNHNDAKARHLKLICEYQYPALARQLGLKNIMCSARHRQGSGLNNEWSKTEERKTTIKEREEKEKLSGAKDKLSEALNRLHNSTDRYVKTHLRWSPFSWKGVSAKAEDGLPANSCTIGTDKSVKYGTIYRHEVFGRKFPDSEISGTASNIGYEIDPITNRKVFKKTPPGSTTDTPQKTVEIPVKTFKGYRSQFQSFETLSSTISEQGDSRLKSPAQSPVGKVSTQNGVTQGGQGGLEDYDNRVSYHHGFYSNEPDGRRPEKPDPVQEGLKDFDSRASYDKPFYSNEPDGKLPEKPDSVQESLKKYDEGVSYNGPFYYNEPDGKAPEKPDPVQEGLKSYDSTVSYEKGFYFNEPDGKLPEKPDPVREALKDYDEKVAGARKAAKEGNKVSSTFDDELRVYCKSYGGKVQSDAEIAEDLDLLRASDVRASSGISKRSKETEAEKFAKRRDLELNSEKSQTSETHHSEEITASNKVKNVRKCIEHQNHIAHTQGLVDAKFADIEREASKSDVRKMSGNYARDFPEEFEVNWSTAGSSGSLAPRSLLSRQQEVTSQDAETRTFARDPNTQRLQPALDRSLSPIRRENSNKISALPTKSDGQVSAVSSREGVLQGEGDLSVFVSSYGPAIARSEVNPESSTKNIEQLMKQDGKELVREIRKIYEDTYGTIDNNHRQVSLSSEAGQQSADTASKQITETPAIESKQQMTSEPVLYKVLAYDPTMQSISTAEASSIVVDSASPLTPAEVLLRLSNPAKFFPHFENLQAQGYEIVAGSGDVLIFRKVRAAAVKASSTVEQRKVINPIDGMQSRPMPATGNFASPTGFVNHDLPVDSNPPFKSNIDVRREEPVFSGRSTWQDDPRSRLKNNGLLKSVMKIFFYVFSFGASAYVTLIVIALVDILLLR